MAKQEVIPVKDNVKKAFMKYCKDNFLKQGQAIEKWMTEQNYLNEDGSLKEK